MGLAAVQAGCAPRRPAPRHVLLVTIDTLRHDRLGCTGHAPARTPVLDALAARGILYPNTVAAAPLTLPSHATILTGRLPVEHGARDNPPFRLAPGISTLAESLAARGHATYAVIGAAPLQPGCGLERGFEHYDYEVAGPAPGSVLLAERPADAVTGAALGLLDRHVSHRPAQPFFLFVHYFDPHAAYAPPEPYRDAFADPYDGEVAFVDHEIGRLLAGLERLGAAPHTLVIVTADHGESFGDHGEEAHGFFLYDSTIRVPLIVADPGAAFAAGVTVGEQVRHQDLRPFIEAWVEKAAFDLTGPARRGEAAFIESLYGAIHCDFAQLRGLRLPGRAKYLEAGSEEFFDLAADPAEQVNLALSAAAPVAAARAEVSRWLARAVEQTSSVERPLGALPGYLDSPLPPARLHTLSREENRARAAPAARLESIRALQEGVRLRESGAFDAAVLVLERGLAGDADNPALLYRLALARRDAARANQSAGQMAAAAAALERTLALRPELASARDLLIHVRTQIGAYHEAASLAAAALADGSATAKTWEALGKLHLTGQGAFATAPNPLLDPEEGRRCLEKALEADPGNAAIHQFLRGGYRPTDDG